MMFHGMIHDMFVHMVAHDLFGLVCLFDPVSRYVSRLFVH